MTDIVIASAVRTPVGSFNGALSSLAAHELGAVAIRAALEQAGVAAADVDEVIMGQVLQAGAGTGPGPSGGGEGRRAGGEPRLVPEPALRLWTPRRRPRLPADRHGGCGDRGLRRAGEHEPGAPRPEPPQRPEDGRPRPRRHHDQGRPVGRLPRLPHGPDGGEHRLALADHPRGTRTASPSPPRTRPRPPRRPASSTARSRRSPSRAAKATPWSIRTSSSATARPMRPWPP